MTRTRIDPYVKGEVVRLRNHQRASLRLAVMAPDGKIVPFPETTSFVAVELDQVGAWKYRWGNGDQVEIEVVPAEEEATSVEAVVPLVRPSRRIVSSSA